MKQIFSYEDVDYNQRQLILEKMWIESHINISMKRKIAVRDRGRVSNVASGKCFKWNK